MEPTLPTERTRLAWQRTTLAGALCLLVVLRLLADVSLPLVAAVVVALLVAAAFLVAATIRRSVRGRRLTTQTAVGRNAALLTALACSACLAAMAYVILS